MKNIVIQHISTNDVKTYYLNFDANGDKSQELLDILMDSLLEFVFGIKYANIMNPQLHNRFFNACEKLYKETRNPKKEGDLGEIILHTLLRKYMGTIPFTGRFYFAVDKNTNAKSFDVIHILPHANKNILVLGESKMYTDAKGGIDALVNDIRDHFKSDYVRRQFVKISEITYTDEQNIQEEIVLPMKRSLDEWEIKLRKEQTLDNVIDELYVPLLCTYTYNDYTNHQEVSDRFIQQYETEMQTLIQYFKNKNFICPQCLSIILMLFPVPDKDVLIQEYYKRIDKGLEIK